MKNKIKVRKKWDFCPVTRIHGEGKQDKKPKYSKKDRHKWEREVDED